MLRAWLLASLAGALFSLSPAAPGAERPSRCVLAIGAHAGDMELTCGAVLAKQRSLGDRIVILHLSLGEAGRPGVKPEIYGDQKRREALAAAAALGAEAVFGPYRDGLVPDDDGARRYVAGIIRQFKPAWVITHSQNSIHKDHITTHRVVKDAVLLAALNTVVTEQPVHRNVSIYYAENWEDRQGFQPYLCINVDKHTARWKEAASSYEFARGGFSNFPYVDYYLALMKVRGAESGHPASVCFDVEPYAKKRVLDSLP